MFIEKLKDTKYKSYKKVIMKKQNIIYKIILPILLAALIISGIAIPSAYICTRNNKITELKKTGCSDISKNYMTIGGESSTNYKTTCHISNGQPTRINVNKLEDAIKICDNSACCEIFEYVFDSSTMSVLENTENLTSNSQSNIYFKINGVRE